MDVMDISKNTDHDESSQNKNPTHDEYECKKCIFYSTFDKKLGSVNFWDYCDDYIPSGHINFSRVEVIKLYYTTTHKCEKCTFPHVYDKKLRVLKLWQQCDLVASDRVVGFKVVKIEFVEPYIFEQLQYYNSCVPYNYNSTNDVPSDTEDLSEREVEVILIRVNPADDSFNDLLEKK